MIMGQIYFWGVLVGGAHDELIKTDFTKKGRLLQLLF